MKKHTGGRIALALTMLLGLLPCAAWAEDETETQAITHAAHCLYGETDCTTEGHTKPNRWIAWDNASKLPDYKGAYYLTTDVEITSTWLPEDNTVLCLNGHTIRMNQSESWETDTIKVRYYTTFTLCDCKQGNTEQKFGKITHAEGKKGCGVYVGSNAGDQGGTFLLYGGEISGNTAAQGSGVQVDSFASFTMYGGAICGNAADTYSGGGVRVYGSFAMEGGIISGNRAKTEGGGVYLSGNADFTMTGGAISENTASQKGGGISVNSNSAFMVSGNASITGNQKGDTTDNCALDVGGRMVIGAGGLRSGAKIGVTTNAAPTAETPVLIVTGAGEDYRRYILSDAGKEISYDASAQEMYLTADVHTHSWGAWKTDAEQHQRQCSTCDAELLGSHDFAGKRCTVCNYKNKKNSASEEPLYRATVSDMKHGTIAISETEAAADTKIILTPQAEKGYELKRITVTGENGETVTLTERENGTFAFRMPEGDVTIEAAFVQKEQNVPEQEAPEQETPVQMKQVITMQIASLTATVGDRTVTGDVAPLILHDRAMVPVRLITEVFGGTVTWNESTRTVILTIDEKEIQMTIGEVSDRYGVAPTIIHDRTFVPVRLVADELSATMTWDEVSRTVLMERMIAE